MLYNSTLNMGKYVLKIKKYAQKKTKVKLLFFIRVIDKLSFIDL